MYMDLIIKNPNPNVYKIQSVTIIKFVLILTTRMRKMIDFQ
jgi:hypothetical protein